MWNGAKDYKYQGHLVKLRIDGNGIERRICNDWWLQLRRATHDPLREMINHIHGMNGLANMALYRFTWILQLECAVDTTHK